VLVHQCNAVNTNDINQSECTISGRYSKHQDSDGIWNLTMRQRRCSFSFCWRGQRVTCWSSQ